MDVGVRECGGVLNPEFLQVFRIVGVVVDQGLDQEAVFDPDDFVVVEGDFVIQSLDVFPLALQFIPPDIAFVQDGVVDAALAEKIASRQAGVAEMEVQGVVGGDPVEGIEFAKLFDRDLVPHVRIGIEFELAEVDVHTLNDSVDESFELLHADSPFEFGAGV
jgi:hypothetical protein